MTLNLYGDIIDSSVTMTIISYNINLAKIPFPISAIHINLKEGSNLTLSANKYKILPGSFINIEKGSKLEINTEIGIYENFIRKDSEEKGVPKYPTGSNYNAAYINNAGGISLRSKAKFSGDIYQNGGTIEVEDGAKFITEFKEGYAEGSGLSAVLKEEANLNTGSYKNEIFNKANKTKIYNGYNDNNPRLIESISDL